MTARTFSPDEIAAAKAWPFEEAGKLDARLKRIGHEGVVVFETGYGPSGPPHIGTFGEVARTTMVRRAFELMTGRKTRLISFSDDMDGMRKVPPHLPNQEMLAQYLQKPLTTVPDPWGGHQSFAHHNNAKLRAFLDQFGFDYEFVSSTECYRSGVFDATLIRVLERYDALMEIMLPSLGEERRETYSPILPISPKTGRVLYVPMLERDAKKGEVVFEDEDGEKIKMPVGGGNTKLQWKVDWAGRWFALGVDYEMAGEDLTESVRLSNRIVKALGGEPPAGFNFQLFVDEQGKKISKTKGNGISIEEWLTYASPESLSLFMFQNPKSAKKLYFDVIPKTLDEYWAHVEKYPAQEGAKALDNPAWHIHNGEPPDTTTPVSFAMLLTLVNAVGGDAEVLKGFIRKYRPNADAAALAAADALTGYAARYYKDFVEPKKQYRAPTDQERAALSTLAAKLEEIGDGADEDAYQTATFDAGKANGYEKNLRDWFKAIYEIVFGQSEGPRMGPFAKIYGAKATAELIKNALKRV
ncbi:MAG TPA: lysine--tRNA ligase [Parvularculaceae bacterium]|nr:lysine--tRNA ligase [Parvularculaceae bacterium]